MSELVAFEDPAHPGNGPEYHTGESCREKGCERPAGTWWSPYWCFEHNVERIRRISGQLDDIIVEQKRREAAALRSAGIHETEGGEK